MLNSMATVDHVQELEKMDIERNLSVTSSRNMNILSGHLIILWKTTIDIRHLWSAS